MKQTNMAKYKSFIDVNNYNKFLMDLDNKNTNTNTTNTTNTSNNITDYVSNIETNYNTLEYNSNNFTGRNIYDTLVEKFGNNVDPNQSENNETIKFNQNIKNNYNTQQKREDIVPIIKQHVNIQVEINNIGDLLDLIDKYPDDRATKYNINMKALHKIKEPLRDLNKMIGMKSLKENIVDQILFYIQDLHKVVDVKDVKDVKEPIKQVSNDFMHTVIYGHPGTGKTEIAKIMGQIFSKIGVLNKGTFKKVTRSDLIAGYLGQTAIKTSDVIKECLGGVLFIDEAYALGSPDKRDSFSKECIDTLCEALSNHKDNLMVIIAGYETDLNECFFNYNQGLNSRFTWRFKTDDYTADDLYKIFIKKANDQQWSISDNKNDINLKWFEKNKGVFKFYGRDIETLFAKVKIAHGRRVFCLDESEKKIVTIKDINKGLEMFIKNENNDSKKADNLKKIMSSMYI